jgi:hypothetical protein
MKKGNLLLVFAAFAFAALAAAWTMLFIKAAHQHIREVPVAPRNHEPSRS